MTEKKAPKSRKLSREILGLLALSLVLTLILLEVLGLISRSLIDQLLLQRNAALSDLQYAQINAWESNVRLIISVGFFLLLFLFLLGERLSYIREVLQGIDALQKGEEDYLVPLAGSNELTELAQAVNYLSQTQREVKERERALQAEKDQFIRTMSHDIRTPLTSILSYTELLSTTAVEPSEQVRYLQLLRHKAEQIKDMTDVLLGGSRRTPEHFENASLLMQQLCGEFEETLEGNFPLQLSFRCPAFSASLDVHELRRLFDNLISNVQKYADPAFPVSLSLSLEDTKLIIREENRARKCSEAAQGYQIGLKSMQRIAQNYSGRLDVQQDGDDFAITITLFII